MGYYYRSFTKTQMKKMKIKIDYRFDSEEVINDQWKIRGRRLSRNIFQIYSPIPDHILEKILSGNYQKLALRVISYPHKERHFST